ncbi:LysR family transcriptional regulator ArgP [Brevundimonas nasdae]|uniref:LysR family transcriptional regulator ArgP n=1 Tax=Brevundimonas nasdae TaxID=172043 RepID=A0ABX8TNN9_9CAUL|nr:LysR family transcriptional regulator ArgP [Brevundimonas nasdae]QYC15888.1 LysR family transcriptional regulator ArgP [Brevundimonas nasdae]
MLDYPSLAAVAAVVRTGSFDAAAQALAVTPSAVSQRVKGLEERLGAPLIVRGSPCTATEAGMRLCAHFNQVALLEHDLLTDEPGWSGALDAGPPSLRIALNADSLATWFPAAAVRFASSGAATLDLILDDEAHTAERLRTGQVLAAVTTTGKAIQGCRTTPLGALRYRATASAAYCARHFPHRVTPDTLALAPVLRFDARDALQDRWMTQKFGAPVAAPTHQAPSTQAFLDLTLAGLAWSMTPEPLAAPLIAQGELIDLDPAVFVDVPLFWRRPRLSSRLIAALTQAVRDAATQQLAPL